MSSETVAEKLLIKPATTVWSSDPSRLDLVGQLAEPRAFWVAYPKGNRSDVNRNSLWPILAEHGMRPISQVAVDQVWSALRFRALEAGEPPFTGGAG
jgi:hypothetical protein